MLVAALQMQPVPGGVQENLGRIERAARSAAAFGAELLVAPELAISGYAIWDDFSRLAERRDGPMVESVARIAREQQIAIVAGFPERDGEMIFNSAVIVQPSAMTHFFRKCHLFGPLEKRTFSPGAAHSDIVTINGIHAGMLICYDVEFPEMVRSSVLAGAELLLVPTALPKGAPANRVSLSMVPTRAFENHVFIIYAGLCGRENGTDYQGGSVMVGPDGEILARAGYSEALLIANINLASLVNLDLDPYLTDRRTALYRL